MNHLERVREEAHRKLDAFLKWGLYVWRFAFWAFAITLLVLFAFNKIVEPYSYLLWICAIIACFAELASRVARNVETIKKDLWDIKQKLGLPQQIRPVDDNEEFAVKLIEETIRKGGCFLDIKQIYIKKFGFKRWLTEGRDIAEAIYSDKEKFLEESHHN